MHWVVASPFVKEARSSGWLTPFLPAGTGHTFSFVPSPPAPDWHHRKTRATGVDEWKRFWKQGKSAWREAAAAANNAGIITIFPQLAAVVGLRKRMTFARRPIVAWSFNLGQLYGGVKGKLARMATRRIDRFVVHSRREIEQYSQWLSVPAERFTFVPIQRATAAVEFEEDRENAFVLAMGSAVRDYRTFFAAVKKLGMRTVVVAAPHAVAGLDVPANVELRSGLTQQQCHELTQRARISVVPVANNETASGQVTVVDAMTYGRPLVATRCIGTEDYLIDDQTGLMVELGSVDAMTSAIERLWKDEPLRTRIASAAKQYAKDHFSNEAVGIRLAEVLNQVESESNSAVSAPVSPSPTRPSTES